MAEYIDREAAVMRLMQDGCSAKNVQSIMELPAADVAPVRHGRWKYHDDIDFWKCSCCGVNAPMRGNFMQLKTNYCPNCGARMDGAE